MKFSGGDSEILSGGVVGAGGGGGDTLLLSATCWGGGGGTPVADHFLLDNKLSAMDAADSEDSSTKATMDALDSLLLTSHNSPPGATTAGSFAELKPLPPFTGYTGHLSINGISGHHYHAIAAGPHSPESPGIAEANNNNAHATNHNTATATGNGGAFKGGVSTPATTSSVTGATLYYTVSTTADQSVVSSSTPVDGIKAEFVDYSSLLAAPDIEDIAAIIGSAIADTTVPTVVDGMSGGNGGGGGGGGDDAAGSRDSWMDLDAWIDTACSNSTGGDAKPIISAETLQEFVAAAAAQQQYEGGSTLQSLLTQSCQYQTQAAMIQQMLKREPASSTSYHMPLLQSRLQNGPPNGSHVVKTEPYLESPSSSTQYLPHTTTGSPPGVVSTTDNSILLNGGRYAPASVQRRGAAAAVAYGHIRGLKTAPSPDLLVNGGSLDGLGGGAMFPHTTTASTTTPSPSKSKSRNRSRSKQQQQQQCGGVVYASDAGGGLLGKEKPVHRCTICNRGFLNKSNIKVHLRTHTGEKPFRCEVCGKAFRQKAHLIKHQQIHKRVGRD